MDYEILKFSTSDSCLFDGQMLDLAGKVLLRIPRYTGQASSQMPGVCPGWMDGFGNVNQSTGFFIYLTKPRAMFAGKTKLAIVIPFKFFQT